MRYDREELEAKARIRNVSIPKLIKDEQVYSPGNPLAASLTTFGWSLFLRRRNVSGLENLDLAMAQISEKRPVTLVGPHLSDADTLFLEQALIGVGREDYAKDRVYIAGLNMNERPHVRVNTLGGNRIFVETPFIIDDLEEVLATGGDFPNREMMTTFLQNGKNLIGAAMREVVKARKRRQAIVMYPQSARSTSGFIERGHPKTETYLKKGIIVPFMVRGSEKFLPPKKFPPILSWIFNAYEVNVEFGDPFEAEDTQRPEVREILVGMGANPVDLVMARVGRMDWERMHPDIRALHQEVDKRVPVKLIAA